MTTRLACVVLLTLSPVLYAEDSAGPADIGYRRELFVDTHLVDKLDGVSLRLERPRDEGVSFRFDKPWEGAFAGYCTIIRDGDEFRAYYRGNPTAGRDGSNTEVT